MAKAIHSMIRVLEEARSVDFYSKAFGLAVADRLDFPSFTLVYLRNDDADFEVELTINKGHAEPYALGTGYGHIAFVVEDLDHEHARFVDLGVGSQRVEVFLGSAWVIEVEGGRFAGGKDLSLDADILEFLNLVEVIVIKREANAGGEEGNGDAEPGSRQQQ